MNGVETAAISAIVSGTLKIVGNKLAPLLIKEYSSIVGVKEDLLELHDFVEEINYKLETVGHNTVVSGPSFHWLKKLKDVSYEVDDVVDKFQTESEKYETNGDGSIVSKYLHTIPKSFISQCKAAKKIKAIKKRFVQIVKQRKDYLAITNSLSVDLPVWPRNMRTVEMPLLPYVDEASVFGRNKDKQLIISKLEETDDQQKINIISVIGLGGTGKTTLAKLVFNDDDIIKKHFKFRLWVHASQEFDIKKLIMKMFEALSDNNLGQHSLEYMSKTISDKLDGKSFLLVLDDVWIESQFQWEKIRDFLVNVGAPGSRILLTTRSAKVAETVGSTELYKLPLLSEASSWQLFVEIYGIASNDLASEFLKVGKEIVHKCGGVPLAIKVLARVLRGKERIDQWEAVRENNVLYVEGEEHRVSACLRLSYLHLPSNIKQCFTICSVFPKGHKIDKEELIDLWIAHDMIALVPGIDYLEDIGHMCFNSLVQMCFLQDVHEYGGRVTCVMHDLVHDLAQSILGDDISLRPEAATSSTKRCRYFSLTEESRNLLSNNIFEKARVMFISKCDDFAFGKTLNNTRHLRSIIVKYNYAASLHRAIAQIKYLRYLSISGQKIEKLPEEISNVWRLQALHVTDCLCLLKLPESIGKLKKLRTLNMSGCTNMMSLPDSIGDCHMISRIDLSHCKKLTYLPNSIGKNKNLRVLRLGYTAIRRLPSSITALDNLECLDLQFCHEMLELPQGIGLLNRLQNLNKFVVGANERSAGISELANVAMNNADLYIGGIKNVMDPDDAQNALLKQKKKLMVLGLNWGRNDADEADKEIEQAVLDCLEPPSGIKELYIGGYCGGNYACWMLKQVSSTVQGLPQFPNLTKMTLWGFPNLKHLDYLMELSSLEVLCLVDMPALESISGGPFPSLVKLVMGGLYSLGEVCMVKQRTLDGGEKGRGFCMHNHQHLRWVQIGHHLPHLRIKQCPKLVVKLYFPYSMEYFVLHRSNRKMLQYPGHGQESICLSSFRTFMDFSPLLSQELDFTFGITVNNARNLSSIVLEYNYAAPLHTAIVEVKYLRYLDISRLKIETLPEEISNLWRLEVLEVTDCLCLLKLPKSIGKLKRLWYLNMSGCTNMLSLPDSIGDCHMISIIDLSHCKKLTSLPNSIGKNKNLRVLKLGYTAIRRLPSSITALENLERLDLQFCHEMLELPQGIGPLNRGIDSLYSFIGKLRSLRYLKICPWGRVVFFNDEDCQLGSLSDPPSSIDTLKLKGCLFSRIPKWIRAGALNDLFHLELLVSGTSTDEVAVLGELPSLCYFVLELEMGPPAANAIVFGAGLFPALRSMCFHFCDADATSYMGFQFQAGVMPRLGMLTLQFDHREWGSRVSATTPVGIEHLLALQRICVEFQDHQGTYDGSYPPPSNFCSDVERALRNTMESHPNRPSFILNWRWNRWTRAATNDRDPI